LNVAPAQDRSKLRNRVLIGSLGITNTGDQSGGEGWTDARDIVKPLTDRVRSVPSHDLAVEREDLGFQHLKLGAKGGNAPTRHVGQSLIAQISGDIEQLFDTLAPNRCNDPKFSEMAAIALITAVCWRMNRWRVRWSIRQLCCSGVLVGTNRMLARVTASQIASASAASFFWRFT
jgi:hypothetical protein